MSAAPPSWRMRPSTRPSRIPAPGADEGVILARMHDAIFEGGGDYPGNPFIIGSGPQALLCRYYSGRRRLDPQDQLTLEFAGVYRQYHACLMRTLLVGQASRPASPHVRRLPGGAAGGRGLRCARADHGRGVRCPGRGARPARHGGSTA